MLQIHASRELNTMKHKQKPKVKSLFIHLFRNIPFYWVFKNNLIPKMYDLVINW